MPQPSDLDPFENEAFRQDPYPMLAEVMAETPVVRSDHALSRPINIFGYDDVRYAFEEWTSYSSQTSRTDDPERMTVGTIEDTFITMDPPRHTSLRRLAQKGFLPSVIASFGPRAEEIARTCVDDALESGELCLVNDFAVPMTVGMITTVLGLPIEDLPAIRAWTVEIFDNYLAQHFLRDVDPDRMATVERITGELTDYFRDYIAERKRSPMEGDIVSQLMTAEIDGVGFTDDEILSTSMLLLTAGNDSTTSLLSNYVINMARFPDQAEIVRQDLSLVPRSIEESVRFLPSFLAQDRVAAKDMTLHGVDIEEGDCVVLWLATANRDPNVFDNPNAFDAERRPNRHLGFGAGIHMCIGAPLARMEAKALANELMSRVGEIELVGDPQLPESTIMTGPTAQTVRFAPA